MSVDYKYNEKKSIEDLVKYVDATYDQHYSKNKFQATEFIIDGGHGDGFCIGNIMKYAQRYGNKDGYNRIDIMKVLHYALIQLYVHDTRSDTNVVIGEIAPVSVLDEQQYLLPEDEAREIQEQFDRIRL